MAELSEERKAMIQNFCSVCHTPEDLARDFLSDNGWKLEESINSYMLLVGGGDENFFDTASVQSMEDVSEAPPAPQPQADKRRGDDEEEAMLQAALQASVDKDGPGGAEGPMPAPPAGMNSRLVDDMPSSMGPAVEQFRNFAAEGMAVPMSAAAVDQGAQDDGMEAMFPPPKDMIFHGNFDSLRKHAEQQEKYCLVNIQQNTEFASHELNRDTWSDKSVKVLVGASFIFWQQKAESSSGREYLLIYPPPPEGMPLVDVVDPLTGALLDRLSGYLAPDAMVERLTRFLDSHTWGKMGKAVATAVHTNNSFYGSEGAPSQRHSIENEDAALQAAIDASLQDGTLPPEGCMDDGDRRSRSESFASGGDRVVYTDAIRYGQDLEFEESLAADMEKERKRKEKEEEELLEQARIKSIEDEKQRILDAKKASLPEEPAAGTAGLVNLMLRFPDGSRKQRKFLDVHKMQVVFDYMHVEGANPEEHTVATSFPRKVLDDPEKTLGELGLHGQALNVDKK